MNQTSLSLSQIISLEVVYTVILIISLFFMIYILVNAKKSTLRNFYVGLSSLLLLSLFATILLILSSSISFTYILIIIKYLAISITSVIFISFAYYYMTDRLLNPITIILLSIYPLFTFLLILTNPIHSLFIGDMSVGIITGNLFYYINSSIADIYIFVGMVIFVFKRRNKAKNIVNKSTASLLILSLILVSKSINYLLIDNLIFNFFVAISSVCMIFVGYYLFTNKLFNIESFGIDKAINNLQEGVVILNKEKKIITSNQSFRSLLKKAYPGTIKVESNIEFQRLLELKKLLPGNHVEGNHNLEREKEDQVFVNVVESTTYDYQGNITGYVLIFRDISEYITMQEDLQKKNIELTKTRVRLENHINDIKTIDSLEKRNALAKELHDILGHTLTVTNLKLQYCIDTFDQNDETTLNNIQDIKEIVRKGMNQLSKSIDEEQVYESVSLLRLRQELIRLCEHVENSGLMTEVTVKGIYKMIPVHVYNAVYRVCQEAITNALRHAKAENIYLIIKYKDNQLSLNIFDDGNGSLEIIKGNGLSGMEQRIQELNGKITFKSIENEGFYIKASIPILSESN